MKNKKQKSEDVAWIYKESEPVHLYFGLTYSSYLVLPRSILQSAPAWWQERFVKLMEEMDAMCEGLPNMPGTYAVQPRDLKGRFTKDPYCDYDRGRRKIQLRRINHD